MNPWHDFPPERIAADDFYAIIEIPKGSKKKYELDKETGLLRLDRILFTATHYPMNYGFVPRTLAQDGDPLDVLVLCSETLDPLTEVQCFPTGVVKMIDNEEVDEKIIAIPFKDPTFSGFRDIYALPPHIIQEVSHFFDVYKALEHSRTSAQQTGSREEAVEIVRLSISRYLELYPAPGTAEEKPVFAAGTSGGGRSPLRP